MRWRKFLPATPRRIVWAGIYTLAAYLAGNALQHASHTIDYSIDGVAVLAVTGVIVEGRHQTARLASKPKPPPPDPSNKNPSVPSRPGSCWSALA